MYLSISIYLSIYIYIHTYFLSRGARNLILLAKAGREAFGNALLLPGPEGLPRRVLEIDPAGSNRLLQVLDLHWRSPESGELWYK